MLDVTHCIKCWVKTNPFCSKLQMSQGTKHSEKTQVYSLNSHCIQPSQTRYLCLYKGWQSKHRTHREALIKHSGLGKWILIEWKKKKQNVFTWEAAFICSGSLKSEATRAEVFQLTWNGSTNPDLVGLLNIKGLIALFGPSKNTYSYCFIRKTTVETKSREALLPERPALAPVRWRLTHCWKMINF